jgi:hypothetical protein
MDWLKYFTTSKILVFNLIQNNWLISSSLVMKQVVNALVCLCFFLIGQTGFPGMVRPIYQSHICLSLEEVTVPAANKVWLKVDNNNVRIVGNSQGIIGQQLRPQPIHLLYHVFIVLIN